ncbi:MAG: response regulator transcription factor [Oscillospiraceae bacterium]|nr:response regulator transcription factor [Oscillospiraceae bacterium]
MIYCVEDDASVRDIELYTLRSTGFSAEGFETAEGLFKALERELPELIILDIMLPGEDGLEILKKLKDSGKTAAIPVILATAKGAEFDKVTGLDGGADDYLVKPFGMLEMVSRVRAVLRRASRGGEESVLKLGSLEMDLTRHKVVSGGREAALTLKEFELLKALLSRPGRVFTREGLLMQIWGMDYDGETRTVDVHIRTLRRKLGENGDMIATVRGVGYKLEERHD